MIFRRMTAALALASLTTSAQAETWMVKSSTLGCRDRETLAALDADRPARAPDGTEQDGCVVLHAGERLLDLPGMAGGFDDYVKLQRHDRSLVFVRSSAIVPDPGIGSIYDDR